MKKKRLPGKGCRIISFIPALNWVSLLYIGILNLNLTYIICAIIYVIITYTFNSLSFLMWIIGIIHYAIAYRNVKKQIKAEQIMSDDISIAIPVYQKPEKLQQIKQKNSQNTSQQPTYSQTTEVLCDLNIAGEPEFGQAIPARSINNDERVGTYISVHNPKEQFWEEMKKYVDKEGQEVPHVPFMTYWPTYDNMDQSQQAWYFYWRTQVRRENYIDTDESYLFVLVYELLNEIGWKTPQEGYKKLNDVWLKYRGRMPKLDYYLPEWIFDFTQLYHLEYYLPTECDYVSLTASPMTDILIDKHVGDIPLKLEFSLIEVLMDYNITSSKFYKEGNEQLLQEAIPRVIALADAALRKQKQKGILAVYGPNRTRKQLWYSFRSAVCPNANQKTEIVVKGYSSNAKLRAYINELVRYGENVLRGLRGYRGRLRGITLDEETKKLIELFLKKEYGEQSVSDEKMTTQKEIALNFDSINHLREQSNAVRSVLAVEEITAAETKELLTDLQEVTSVYSAIDTAARALLSRLAKAEWEIIEQPGDEVLLKEINRFAEFYLGCMLIVNENGQIIAEDDYRDELEYIYKNPPQLLEQEDVRSIFQNEALPSELKDFVDALVPEQQEVLHALLVNEHPQSRVAELADKLMTMPDILLDDINAVAMQLLGDIIIDATDQQPYVIEEYSDYLKKSIA